MTKILENVVKLLKKDKKFRNNDVALVLGYWKKFDKAEVVPPTFPITSPATIIRFRQKLQSKGEFLPTDPDVIIKRRKQRYQIERALGYI